MKKVLSLVLSVLLVITSFSAALTFETTASAESTNLVTDGTFEGYATGLTSPSNSNGQDETLMGKFLWYDGYCAAGNVALRNISANGWTGSDYAKVEISETEAHGGSKSLLYKTGWQVIYKAVAVEKNTDYIFSYWYYQTDKKIGTNAGRTKTVYGIEKNATQVALFKDGDNNMMAATAGGDDGGESKDVAYGKQVAITATEKTTALGSNSTINAWTKVELAFNSGDSERVVLPFFSEGTMYIDDVKLEKFVAPTDAPDDTFESFTTGRKMWQDLNGANLYGWVDSGVNRVSFYTIGGHGFVATAYGRANISNEEAHGGSKSLKITSQSWFRIYSVKANTNYEFTFWYKAENAESLMSASQEVWGIPGDATKIAIRDTFQPYATDGGTDGGENSDQAYGKQAKIGDLNRTGYGTSGAWAKASIKFNSGEFTKVMVPISIDESKGVVYVDDLALEEKAAPAVDAADDTFESFATGREMWKDAAGNTLYHWVDKGVNIVSFYDIPATNIAGSAYLRAYISEAQAHSGTKSLKLTQHIFFRVYSVKANTNYEFTFWYYTPSADSLKAASQEVWGIPSDATSIAIKNTDGVYETAGGTDGGANSDQAYGKQAKLGGLVRDGYGTANAWTKASIKFESGEFTKVMLPVCINGTDQEVYIDDLTLTELKATEPNEFDGTFESFAVGNTYDKNNIAAGAYFAGADSIAAGWTDRLSYTNIRKYFGRTFYGKGVIANAGDAHGNVLDVANANADNGLYVIYDVEANKDYAISYYYKQSFKGLFISTWSDGSTHPVDYSVYGIDKDATILVTYNNADVTACSAGTFQFTDAAHQTYTKQEKLSTTCLTNNIAANGVVGEWTKVMVKFNTGSNTRIAVPFRAQAVAPEYCYIDDVELIDLSAYPKASAVTTGFGETNGGFAKVSYDKLLPEAGDTLTYTAQAYDYATFNGWYIAGTNTLVSNNATYTTTFNTTNSFNYEARFTANAKNLIKNGDFESYAIEYNIHNDLEFEGSFVTPTADGWALSESWVSADVLNASYGVDPHYGNQLLGLRNINNCIGYQAIVEPHTTYKWTFYYYVPAGQLAQAVVFGIDEAGDMKYSSGSPVAEGRQTLMVKNFQIDTLVTPTVNNAWQKVELIFNSGNNTCVELNLQASGDLPEQSAYTVAAGARTKVMFTDDWSLIKMAKATTGYVNGDISEFTEDTIRRSVGAVYYSGFGTTIVKSDDANNSITNVAADDFGTGEKAVKFTTKDGFMEIFTLDTAKVEKGKEYMAYVWVKTSNVYGLSMALFEPGYIDTDGESAFSARMADNANLYSSNFSGAKARTCRTDIEYTAYINDVAVANSHNSFFNFGGAEDDFNTKHGNNEYTKIAISFKVPEVGTDADYDYNSNIAIQLANYGSETAKGADVTFYIAEVGVEEIVTPNIEIVSSFNTDGGYAYADKAIYHMGDAITYTAGAYADNEFEGWFAEGGDTPISKNLTYTTTVDGSKIIAKFSGEKENLLSETGFDNLPEGAFISADDSGEFTGDWNCVSSWVKGNVVKTTTKDGSPKALQVKGRHQSLERKITLEANTNYTFSLDYFLASIAEDDSTSFSNIYVVKGDAVYDDQGQAYKDSDIIFRQSFGENPDLDGKPWPASVLDAWTNASVEFNTGANTEVKICVQFASDKDEAVIYYDNLTLYKGESSYTPGDINNDGEVDDKDVSTLRKYLAGWSVTVNTAALDCNGDGESDDKDASHLAKYLAGWSANSVLY